MSNKILICLFIIFLIIIGAYLTIKATYENSWDGWGFGSAQTMTSIKHWVKDGWAFHYFLFIPAGYSKLTSYFDNPGLNQHAWVDVTGSTGQKRVYYTHFPPGYLFPLAFLMELGVQNRFWFRFLQILISLTSLLFLYKFFNLIANPTIAFVGSLFYALSVPFLNFADSLANMPIDDFFRLAILTLSILAIRSLGNSKQYKLYNIIIWLSYLLLSISSYDSTFFIFAWLIGLDIINKQYNWKKWFYFASAPILAFGLQAIQNSWYLGLSGMISDFLHAFNKIGLSAGGGQGFIQTHFLQGILYPITEAFALSFRARYVFIFILTLFIILLIIKKNKEVNSLIPSIFNHFNILIIASFCQSLIVLDNHPYKGRILGIFAAFLIGTFIFLIIQFLKNKSASRPLIMTLFLLTALLIFLQANRTLAYIRQWPNNIYDPEKIKFSEELKNITLPFKLQNPIIFSVFPPSQSTTVYYDMYYSDAPILYFKNINKITQDFTYLKQISKYPFSALIILKDKNQADELLQSLPKISIKTFLIQNKYILLIF